MDPVLRARVTFLTRIIWALLGFVLSEQAVESWILLLSPERLDIGPAGLMVVVFTPSYR